MNNTNGERQSWLIKKNMESSIVQLENFTANFEWESKGMLCRRDSSGSYMALHFSFENSKPKAVGRNVLWYLKWQRNNNIAMDFPRKQKSALQI